MYGVRRGIKSPGEFGVSDILGLGLSGAAGIVAALVTDYQQQGESSALFTVNQWIIQAGSLLGFSQIPLWMVVLGMTAVGAVSIFYFQPITRQGAFAQGFGLLAVLMTAIPADLAGGIQAIGNALPGLEPAGTHEASMRGGQIINAAYRPGEARLYRVQQGHDPAKYDVHLQINFPNGFSDDIDTLIRTGAIRGRLHNDDTNETWNLFRSAGGTVRHRGNSLIIEAGVPARSATARLWVRIETKGYTIEEQSATATLGETLNWSVDMKATRTPLFLQRWGRSYRY
ncbi:MAG: hypothetical protein GXP06_13000 [Alphaproteobacteria bacterium]|nr:hypothetical protein [Alphaproteobacteria bacterium]